MSAIKILGLVIEQNANGLYPLTQLFKASGGLKVNQPSDWLKTAKTKDLVASLIINSNPIKVGVLKNQLVIDVVQGSGDFGGGTYACKELVYAYAMWINSDFFIKVVQAFDHLANDRVLEAQAIANTTINDIIKKREPNDVSTLAVVVGCTVYESRYYYEVLVANGLLTKKVNKEGQAKFFPVGTPDWFEGHKRNTMLFNDKILAHIPLQSDWVK